MLVLIGAALATYLLLGVGRDVNANMEWYGSPNGILEEDFVELGGHPQYVRIRGRDRNNPVLLDLHGGPAAAWVWSVDDAPGCFCPQFSAGTARRNALPKRAWFLVPP